jgi:hypothetical protein
MCLIEGSFKHTKGNVVVSYNESETSL